MSELCLRLYLDEYEETPWDALKYLVAEINYGGRVTDDMDRRLMNTYMAAFFNDDALTTPNFKLSTLSSYVIPEDGPLSMYKEVRGRARPPSAMHTPHAPDQCLPAIDHAHAACT